VRHAELLSAEWVVIEDWGYTLACYTIQLGRNVDEISTNCLAFFAETVYAYSEKSSCFLSVPTTLEHRVRGACNGVGVYYVFGA
jgi:hypothetical protein